MGYTTDFEGSFKLDKQLTVSQAKTLTDFSEERHGGPLDSTPGMPGFWCDWTPTADRCGIEWNGSEKFYEYFAWLQYVIDHYIKPWGLTLNGAVSWQGEDSHDMGQLIVKSNIVTMKNGRVVYDS